jgi:hypothetical protein
MTATNLIRIGPDPRVLKQWDSRFVVKRTVIAEDVRGEVFKRVLLAMEENELGRVQRCSKCKFYFVAEHLGTEICSAACRKANSRESMRKNREKTRKEEQARRVKARVIQETRQFERFSRYMAARNNPNIQANNELLQITNKLPGRRDTLKAWDNQLRKNGSLKDLWRSLPNDQKVPFLEYSSR